MKLIVICILTLFSFASFGQSKEEKALIEHRADHLLDITDSTEGILTKEEITEFEGLDYYPFDKDFKVRAKFTIDIGDTFEMPTSTERKPVYRRYGYLHFQIDGKNQRLTVYQNMAFIDDEDYEDYLFIPFRDSTSSHETYGGGRYLDFKLPKRRRVKIDFNYAYNPYCAYSYRFSCPIPPEENTLKVAIKAGEKTPIGH